MSIIEKASSDEVEILLDKEFFKTLQLKIFVIGDSGVGKSCLMLRYVNDVFESSYLSTIGMDYKCKVLNLFCEESQKEEEVNVQIWDTAGQERFLSITVSQYREAHGIMLCYDITEEISFNHVLRWLKNIKENTEKDIAIILCGNKSDLQHKRVVEKNMGELLSQEHKMQFIECSAKSGLNVKKAFNLLAKQAFSLAIQDQMEKKKIQKLENEHIKKLKNDNNKKNGRKCC